MTNDEKIQWLRELVRTDMTACADYSRAELKEAVIALLDEYDLASIGRDLFRKAMNTSGRAQE